jgi:small-conductance mechanosensitive channel
MTATPLKDQSQPFDIVSGIQDIRQIDQGEALAWVTSFGPGIAAGVATFIGLIFAKRVLVRLLKKGHTPHTGWRSWVLPFVENLSPLLFFAAALSVGVQIAPTSAWIDSIARRAISIAVFVQIGLIATMVLKMKTDRLTRAEPGRKFDPTAATMFQTIGMIGQIAIWAVVLLLCLENVGVDVTTLIAGVGIGGVAVAFAFKSILEDVFASLSIAFDKPFVIGDFIISGEHMGTVEKIGIKNIRIRSLSGEQIIINTNDILASRVRNYGRMYERRVVFTLGVEYGTPLETLRTIPGMIRTIIEAQEKTRFDRSHFKDYGDFSLNFETVYYILDPDYNRMMDIQQAINLDIYAAFDREGIAFAFPTQTLHIASHVQNRDSATNQDSHPLSGQNRIGA